MIVCLNCGQVTQNTDAFCPRCGKPLPPSSAASVPSATVYTIPAPAAPGPEEMPAVEHFGTASLLGMIAFLISTASAAIALVYLRSVITVRGSNNTIAISQNLIPILWGSAGIEAVSLVILIGAFVYYRKAFTALAPRAPTFSTPATLTVVAIVGAALLIVAAFLEANYTVVLINCLNQPGATASSCVNGRGLLASLGVVALAAIIFLVGMLGTLVGVWRVGVRYQKDLPRIGAVLSIFPYVNWIGMLLNYMGATDIRTRLRGGGGPGAGGAT